ncbi:MAG: hypothetical protein Ct9H300mP23_03630 [Nitrospinota bacterium]|nr:MAG: hypothetical protein Ct9H300mP23_03630 [Nitrospinota bacterium]
MENEQIQEYCEEALKISKVNGIQNGLSYLFGGKNLKEFSTIKKAQKNSNFYTRARASNITLG